MTSKNYLAIDYGTKRVGLAIAISGIISPLDVVPNDSKLISEIQKNIEEYSISKIFVGISEGNFALETLAFVKDLKTMLQCPIETVEEAVSTIEATEIYLHNKRKKKDYKSQIDALSAAVILKRALG